MTLMRLRALDLFNDFDSWIEAGVEVYLNNEARDGRKVLIHEVEQIGDLIVLTRRPDPGRPTTFACDLGEQVWVTLLNDTLLDVA